MIVNLILTVMSATITSLGALLPAVPSDLSTLLGDLPGEVNELLAPLWMLDAYIDIPTVLFCFHVTLETLFFTLLWGLANWIFNHIPLMRVFG